MRQALLLAAREPPRRLPGEGLQPEARQRRLGARPRAGRAAAPQATSAWSRLARTDRRSSTGRWNTIACARAARSGSAQATRPSVGAISPWQSRSSRLLPAPFGPSTTSRRPGRTVRSIPSSSCASAGREAEALDPERQDRRLGPHPIARRAHRPIPWAPALIASVIASRIIPSATASAEVAAAGLQRDRRRHRAGVPRDVAADDQHRADLSARPAEPCQHAGQQAESPVPKQRRHRPEPRRAERAQLLLVFVPEVLDDAAGQRHHDRQDQHRLRQHHRRRA